MKLEEDIGYPLYHLLPILQVEAGRLHRETLSKSKTTQMVPHVAGLCWQKPESVSVKMGGLRYFSKARPWWCKCVIYLLGRLRQEDNKFKINPDNLGRSCLHNSERGGG